MDIKLKHSIKDAITGDQQYALFLLSMVKYAVDMYQSIGQIQVIFNLWKMLMPLYSHYPIILYITNININKRLQLISQIKYGHKGVHMIFV